MCLKYWQTYSMKLSYATLLIKYPFYLIDHQLHWPVCRIYNQISLPLSQFLACSLRRVPTQWRRKTASCTSPSFVQATCPSSHQCDVSPAPCQPWWWMTLRRGGTPMSHASLFSKERRYNTIASKADWFSFVFGIYTSRFCVFVCFCRWRTAQFTTRVFYLIFKVIGTAI